MNLRLTSCAYLRCKKDFYTQEGSEEYISEIPQNYWCGKTLGQFGPDDDLAELPTCQPGRPCHRETATADPVE